MSSYGRNFQFTVPPSGKQRKGQFYNDGVAIPIGAPVIVDLTNNGINALDLVPVVLATTSQAIPKNSQGGIGIYEYGPAAFAGDDPTLTTYSDKDTIPAGAACVVVSGDDVKVRFTNTIASTFLNTRAYAGRVMVAGIGATPTVSVGNLLTPGTGNDAAGYWAKTTTAANGWLIVTKVDNTRTELEAQLAF